MTDNMEFPSLSSDQTFMSEKSNVTLSLMVSFLYLNVQIGITPFLLSQLLVSLSCVYFSATNIRIDTCI